MTEAEHQQFNSLVAELARLNDIQENARRELAKYQKIIDTNINPLVAARNRLDSFVTTIVNNYQH